MSRTEHSAAGWVGAAGEDSNPEAPSNDITRPTLRRRVAEDGHQSPRTGPHVDSRRTRCEWRSPPPAHQPSPTAPARPGIAPHRKRIDSFPPEIDFFQLRGDFRLTRIDFRRLEIN